MLKNRRKPATAKPVQKYPTLMIHHMFHQTYPRIVTHENSSNQ